jgi:hypothetical protein
MKDDTTEQRVLFTELVDRPLHMQFDQPDSSSDGGALLLKAADQSLGLTQRLSQCLRDKRNPDFIIHSYHDMLRQRIYGICCGYEDCNDAARLAGDPIHRLMIDRDPQLGQDLASQPTLSRFENAIDVRSLDRMGEELAEQVVARHHKRLGKKVKKITIDMDPTDDPTYGQQQLTFFNSHYANWCYLPVAGFLQFNAAGQVMNRINICSATCCGPAMFTPAMVPSPYCDASLKSYASISPESPFRRALTEDTPRRRYSSTLKMKASGMSLQWRKTLY